MRRMLAVGVLLVVALVFSTSAVAATPSPTEKKLAAQVAALQKQIPAMQKQIKTLQGQVKELQTVTSAVLAINICSTAITADALQLSWGTLSAVSTVGAVFGTPESAVNDTGACQAAKVTRQTAGPPNLSPFKALLSIFASFGAS
jgi:TolA-binding protein